MLKFSKTKIEKSAFSVQASGQVATAMQLQCNCNATAMELQCNCNATAMRLQCDCNATAIQLQCNWFATYSPIQVDNLAFWDKATEKEKKKKSDK